MHTLYQFLLLRRHGGTEQYGGERILLYNEKNIIYSECISRSAYMTSNKRFYYNKKNNVVPVWN